MKWEFSHYKCVYFFSMLNCSHNQSNHQIERSTICTSLYLKFQTPHQCIRNYETIFHTTMLFCHVLEVCGYGNIYLSLRSWRDHVLFYNLQICKKKNTTSDCGIKLCWQSPFPFVCGAAGVRHSTPRLQIWSRGVRACAGRILCKVLSCGIVFVCINIRCGRTNVWGVRQCQYQRCVLPMFVRVYIKGSNFVACLPPRRIKVRVLRYCQCQRYVLSVYLCVCVEGITCVECLCPFKMDKGQGCRVVLVSALATSFTRGQQMRPTGNTE